MKRKRLITALVITAAITIPVSVYAATSDSTAAKTVRNFLGIDTSKLTATQKADITSYKQKMAELQKEFINKMVANGSITKEQGDAQIAKIDEMLKNNNSSYIPGFENGKGGRGGNLKDGYGMFGIDTSKLTDSQKSDLTAAVKKIAELQKELVNKAVENKILTKTQGDSFIKSIDDSIAGIASNGFSANTRLFEGFNCFGILKNVDTTKLTDAQKAIFTDYSTKLAALQKELVNKMVSNGALTSEQGTTATAEIDEMSKLQSENGFLMNKGGMWKDHMGGHGRFERGSSQNGNTGDSSTDGSTNNSTNNSTITGSTSSSSTTGQTS